MKRLHLLRCVAVALCFLLPATGECAQNPDEGYTPQIGQEGKDVIWLPTLDELTNTMLDLAKVTSSDYVIDLGSGDGRLVIAAAKRGATALGIEYNPQLVEFSKQAAAKEGVSAKATFEEGDIFKSDFSKATVLTLFLEDKLNLALRPKILNMKPGTRVVSNTFKMAEWEPDQTVRTELTNPANGKTGHFLIYFWTVPAKVTGIWKLDTGHVSFTQNFQKVIGTLTTGGKNTELTGRLNGTKITFTAGGTEYTGTVSGNTISGMRTGGGFWKATR